MKEIYNKLKMIKRNLLIRGLIFVFGLILVSFNFINFINASKFSTGGNVVFVLDLTNSMNVKDVFYNHHQVSRLTLAKKIIENTAKKLDLPVGVIIFADKFNYYIPPTLDDETLNQYVEALNTNYLDGGVTNLEALSSGINNYVNQADMLVFLSDFDWENIDKFKIHNFGYFVGIGKPVAQPVENSNGQKLYKNGKLLFSSLNEKVLKKLGKKYGKYYIVDNLSSGKMIPFLEKIKFYQILGDGKKVDISLIFGLFLVIISL